MASRVASSIRPNLLQSAQPSSPHTPTRFASSTFSSPGSIFRQEEDAVVIEVGSRFIRAGFEGENGPQCTFSFGPEDSRRVGDYRVWARGHTPQKRRFEDWAKAHELWRMDLKDVDIGLVEDKIERAVREIYNKYLLTEAGAAKLLLVLPSVLPHPLLSALLYTLFNRWKFSAITLLPSPAMAALAAGLRSALVVDIGWHETTLTSIYEYRELRSLRTTRAMKTLIEEMGRHVLTIMEKQNLEIETSGAIDYDLVEDIAARLALCRSQVEESNDDPNVSVTKGVNSLSLAEDRVKSSNIPSEDDSIEVDWPSATSSQPIHFPFRIFYEPVEANFLDSDNPQHRDDHEQSLPILVYKALLHLPPDVRAWCMSRVVFVGGGSAIPGLPARILREVAGIVSEYGWTPVRGKRVDARRKKLAELSQGGNRSPSAWAHVPAPPGQDFVEEKLQKQQAKHAQSRIHGVLRQVDSVGAWAGASMLATLKVKGFVEVERDRFLSHGLSGAHRHVDTSVVPQRQSFAPGISKTGGDRSSWTLAGWA